MNYLKTLLFISKCLTVSSNRNSKKEVEQIFKNQVINWDNVVIVSSNHYVFPSLYCNLSHANLLEYVPDDLVAYMKYIADLNRDRNLEILEQVKEINKLLLSKNITPIFLKGASFLVENLYLDIAERMIGDIDFIVSPNDFAKTVAIFKKNDYKSSKKEECICLPEKHYPKMVKKGKIAAIEIHSDIILNKNSKLYNYSFFYNTNRIIDKISIPSSENQIIHNCINKQFSDRGRYYKSLALRNSYDLYRLSFNAIPLKVIKKDKIYFEVFNTYIGTSYFLFKSKNLMYEQTKQTSKQITIATFLLKKPIFYKLNKFFYDSFFYLRMIVLTFIGMFYKKECRNSVFYKISNFG
jgi:hypothetical protein